MSLKLLQKFGVVEFVGSPIIGKRRFGVPVGGAFDLESFALANALVGNPVETAIWELGMAQATFRSDYSGSVAIVGGIAEVLKDGSSLATNSAFGVFSGEEFTVKVPSAGARTYLAWNPIVRAEGWIRRLTEPPSSVLARGQLRVVTGPQGDQFDLGLLSQEYSVSRTINRVGVRFNESIGAHRIELPSEPQCVGTIQVSNDGTPIIIGPDGPTIGGYPKIAVVISSDLSRVAQLMPGASVLMELVSLEAARAINAETRSLLELRVAMLSLGSQM